MTKDRLTALKSIQKQYSENSNEENLGGNISDSRISIEQKDAALENFLEDVNDIKSIVDDIKVKVEDVDKKHSKILAAVTVDHKSKQELDVLMGEIKQLSNKVRVRLKAADKNIQDLEAVNEAYVELRIRKTQHAMLSRHFRDVMLSYNNVQNDYKERCRSRIRRQLEITGRVTSEEELEDLFERDEPAIFTQGLLLETQQARQALADIEDRHADLIKLENSIREIRDLFVDISMLIDSQGEIVDQIEHHVLSSVDHVDTGKGQLAQARVLQTKSRKKMIFIGICLVITVLVLIILLISFLT